jgi:hypothetical protein
MHNKSLKGYGNRPRANGGGKYQLQYSSGLSSTNWINLSNAATVIGPTLGGTDSTSNGPRRFYRAVLSP